MKKHIMRWLSSLLIAALLLIGTALMEEAPAIEEAQVAEDISVTEEVPAVEDDIEIAVEPEDIEVAETEAALEAETEEVADIPGEEIVEETAPLFAMGEAETVTEEAEKFDKLPVQEGDIPLDAAHFPDPAFRTHIANMNKASYANGYPEGYVPAMFFKTCNILRLNIDMQERYGDGVFQGFGITSLKGIEYFTNLTSLDCSFNPITSLDVSMLKNLEGLGCNHCSLTSLNASGLPKLKSLDCSSNKLTSMNISNCTALNWVWAVNNNLTSLDISTCPLLTTFSNTKYRSSESKTVYKYYHNGVQMFLDKKTKLVTKAGAAATTAAVPAVAASFAEVAGKVPATVAVDPTSTAKNTKATALAAPGSAMQLNLGGATGKKFKSSKKKVATVNKNGVVTFKKGGKVKITYKVGKQTRKVTLTVIDPTMPKAVALNQTGTVAVKVGDAVTLTATMNEGAVSAIKWKTSNKKVATVKNGVVTFKKAGKVTITAVTKRGKKKAKVTYTVSKQ